MTTKLRVQISSQELPPGSKLRETDLAKEFRVSRARVRDAFVALEQLGLIERIPNRGAVVTRLVADQLYQLYDISEVLEGLAVRLATERGPKSLWEEHLHHLGPAAERLIEAGEIEQFGNLARAFRDCFTEQSGSDALTAILRPIYERTVFPVKRLLMTPNRAKAALLEHRAVLTAMIRGDATDAERLRRLSIRAAHDCFVRYQKLVL